MDEIKREESNNTNPKIGIKERLKGFFSRRGKETYGSMVFMGVGQMMNGQFGKGIIYMLLDFFLNYAIIITFLSQSCVIIIV